MPKTINGKAVRIGVMLRREIPPENLVQFAQRAENTGFDEVWIVEDCFYGGGIAYVGAALAHTTAIQVGLGIMPAVVRNPAFTAMEVATLARLYPNRFLPGLGHGVRSWMQQIGELPKSQLTALGEVTHAVRGLLRGKEVTMDNDYVQLDQVQLEFPPEAVPPISLGVRGPKSLTLSGRVADGTILSEGSSPAYVRWAREKIAEGQAQAGRTEHHHVTVYVLCCLRDERGIVYNSLRHVIVEILGGIRSQLAPLNINDEIDAMIAEYGTDNLPNHIPDEWVDHLAVAGTPGNFGNIMEQLADAGADSIVLVPVGFEPEKFWEIVPEIVS